MISKFNCSIRTWTAHSYVYVLSLCVSVCVCVCVRTALLHVIRVFYLFNWFLFWTFICNLSSKTYSAIYVYRMCIYIYVCISLYTIRKYYVCMCVSVCVLCIYVDLRFLLCTQLYTHISTIANVFACIDERYISMFPYNTSYINHFTYMYILIMYLSVCLLVCVL